MSGLIHNSEEIDMQLVRFCFGSTDDNFGELDLEGIDDEEIEQVRVLAYAWTVYLWKKTC